MHDYALTDPQNAEIARRYYRWICDVRETLATGTRVMTVHGGDYHTPATFRDELWRAIERRINLRGGGLPAGRKWDSDYYWQAWRDSRALRGRVLLRVYQFETAEARRRFGHLLTRHDEA